MLAQVLKAFVLETPEFVSLPLMGSRNQTLPVAACAPRCDSTALSTLSMGAEIRPGTVLSVEKVKFEEACDLAPEPATVYGPDRAEDNGDGTCRIIRGQPE